MGPRERPGGGSNFGDFLVSTKVLRYVMVRESVKLGRLFFLRGCGPCDGRDLDRTWEDFFCLRGFLRHVTGGSSGSNLRSLFSSTSTGGIGRKSGLNSVGFFLSTGGFGSRNGRRERRVELGRIFMPTGVQGRMKGWAVGRTSEAFFVFGGYWVTY